MRKLIITSFALAVFLSQLSISVLSANLSNIRPNSAQFASVAIENPSHFPADKEGTISFQNLESKLRSDNNSIQSLTANLNSILAFNREKEYDDLLKALNGQVDLLWNLQKPNSTDENEDELNIPSIIEDESKKSKQIMQLQGMIPTFEAQLEKLDKEDYEKMIETTSRQTEFSIQQIIIGTESLYYNILSQTYTLNQLNRTHEELKSTLEVMQLRYEMGQISLFTLQEFEANFANLNNQIASLENAIKSMKATLGTMLGLSPQDELQLNPLPQLTPNQNNIISYDYATALESAKNNSFTLWMAKQTLEDAQEQWDDDRKETTYGTSKYNVAYQKYLSAIHTYDSEVKDFELNFLNLYNSLSISTQKISVAKSSLKTAENNYNIAKFNHQNNRLSDHALQTALHELLTAKESLQSEQNTLYATYRTYEQAVTWGIVTTH